MSKFEKLEARAQELASKAKALFKRAEQLEARHAGASVVREAFRKAAAADAAAARAFRDLIKAL